MTDIYQIYRNAIVRLGEGVYFFYSKEIGKTYPFDVQVESLAGQPTRLFIQDDGIRYYLDSPEFVNYINGLELVGVVQLSIRHARPQYLPLDFS